MVVSDNIRVILENDTPLSITWRNRDYKITKIGLRHDYYEGKTLVHIFSALSDDLFLKFKFDTKHLIWNLIEIYQM